MYIHRKHFILFTFIVTLFLLSTIPPTPNTHAQSTGSTKQLGVHAFTLVDRVNLLQQLNVQVVRLPMTWHLLEGNGKGQTPQWFWDELDAEVAAAEQAGVDLIIEMALTPCWASSDPNKNCSDPTYDGYLRYPPTNPADYGDALARVAQRYRGRVLAYEIWNEPNLVGNWLPLGPRPTNNDGYDSFIDLQGAYAYTTLVKATYAKVKAADPDTKVLAGAIAGGDVAYVEALYNAGIAGSFDALSIHPYTDVYPVGSTDLRYGMSYGPDECPTGVQEPKFWCFQLGVERIHAVMTQRGDTRPIWFTEFGFSSTTVWNGSGLQGQADHLQRAIELIYGWDFVPVAAWYNLVDFPEASERETRFGLFDSNLAIKPAGVAFQTAVANPPTPTPGATPTPTPVPNQPLPLAPIGTITTNVPQFSWQGVPGATLYKLWVNEYNTPNVPGKINRDYTPAQANCAQDTVCTVTPNVIFAPASAEWWVTAYFANESSVESDGALFTVSAGSILWGDCNGDDRVDAGDLSATTLEIFDGDGASALNVAGGTFVGAAGCDANQDTVINAGDLSCTVLSIFSGLGACSTE